MFALSGSAAHAPCGVVVPPRRHCALQRPGQVRRRLVHLHASASAQPPPVTFATGSVVNASTECPAKQSFRIVHKPSAPLRTLGEIDVTIVSDPQGVDKLVQTLKEYSEKCEASNEPPLVAVDCEWKPDFMGAMERDVVNPLLCEEQVSGDDASGEGEDSDCDAMKGGVEEPTVTPPPVDASIKKKLAAVLDVKEENDDDAVVASSPAEHTQDNNGKRLTNRARRMREKLARRAQRRAARGLAVSNVTSSARVKKGGKRKTKKGRKARIRSRDWNEVALLQLATRDRVYIIDMLSLLPPRHVVGGPVVQHDQPENVDMANNVAAESVDRLLSHLLLASIQPHSDGDEATITLATTNRLVLCGHGLHYDFIRLTAGYATRVPSLMALRKWPESRHTPGVAPLCAEAPLLTRARTLEVSTFLRAAGRITGSQSRGLASLMKTALGITVDKSEQCSDWSQRPLTNEQILYASVDVCVVATCVDRYWRNVVSARAAAHAAQRAQARPGGRAHMKAERDANKEEENELVKREMRWYEVIAPLTSSLRTGTGWRRIHLR